MIRREGGKITVSGPVTLANVGVQAAAMAKDSTGVIWATWGYPSGGHGNGIGRRPALLTSGAS